MSQSTWVSEFEVYARDIAEENQIPGMAVAVAQNGDVIYEAGFGYRNVEQALPATAETVFGLASVSKSFTALAIMQLDDAGTLSVDDPIIQWLPEFRLRRPTYEQDITIHHLLTNTSGLTGLAYGYVMTEFMRKDPDRQKIFTSLSPEVLTTMPVVRTYQALLELIAELDFELLGPPGKCMSYAAVGYSLLACIVERASGKPFASYLQEHVLEPVGMTRTTVDEERARLPTVTQLYLRDKERTFASPTWPDRGQIYGSGGLVSTVQDLIRYLEVYRNKGWANRQRIVSAAAIEKMTTPHAEVLAIPGIFYGYGLFVRPDYHGATLVSHRGGLKGVTADVHVVLEKDITVTTLCNLSGMPAFLVSLAAINALMGLPLDTPLAHDPPEYELNPQQLARFVGRYGWEKGFSGPVTRFYMQDDVLYRELRGQSIAAKPYAKDGVVVAGERVRFLMNDAGDVWAAASQTRIEQKLV